MFIVGSILAGLSWNLTSMIIFRVIQAIAGSADYPTAMAILSVTFTDAKKRAQALGIWSSAFAASAVFGPLLGGPLIDNFGWRSVFLVNLPVGLIGLAMALLFIKESVSGRKNVKFDWWGSITLGGALASLVLVLDKGTDWGWLSTNSLLTYGAVLLFAVVFAWIERKVAEPIIDFKFFKIPSFVYTLLNNFFVFMCMMGSVFLLPVFAQTFLGYSATESGFIFIPMGLAIPIGAAIGGKFAYKFQPRYVIFVSTAFATIGFFLLSGIDPRSTVVDLMIPLGIMAFFMGLGMAQRTNIIASVVPQTEIGIASGILALVRNIGGAFGISVFATLLKNFVENNVLTISGWSSIHSVVPYVRQEFIGLIELKAQTDAYGEVFLICACVMLAASFLSFFIKVRHQAHNVTVHVE